MTEGTVRTLGRLERSSFRRKQRLDARDAGYLRSRGLTEVMAHAARFVDERLAPARPENDGRQTPMRGHPAFVAQHATATCCRGCLARWHDIPSGRALTPEQRERVLALLEAWLGARLASRDPVQRELF